ncbi:MAG: HU family DNA-binding protein [Bdellovibrionales bacterium]|nr:HU family DNA-binding protein [Bdellovibrionales bacterium]
MNKAELIDQLAQKNQISKTQSEEFLNSILEIVQKSVCSGQEVKLVGFGTFDRAMRKSRNGRNPKTGSLMTIPASCVPRFRPGKDFKESTINGWRKKSGQL